MSSGDGASLAVPKFGSFKSDEPKMKPKDRDDDRKAESRDGRRKRTHDDDKHERRRRRSRECKRRKGRPRSRERDSQPEKKSSEDKPTPRAPQPKFFTIDTQGDPLIRRYGTLDRSQVPPYYRHGRGRVLGTSGRLVIYRDGPNDRFGLRMPGESTARYRDKDGLRSRRPTAHSQPITLRKRRVPTTEDDEDEGFLSLKSSKKRVVKQESSEDENGLSYRSIEGKAKPKTHDGDSDDSASDSAIEVDNLEENNPLKWKSIQLNRRVKEHPEDIDSWLELVDHQDALLRASMAEGYDPDNEAHSYSEIKTSMLEKALKNAKDAADKDRILVPLMREGGKVWGDAVTAKKWEELDWRADSQALFRARLEFTMTCVPRFQFIFAYKMLVQRLSHISRRARDTCMFLEVIEVFLRATRFMQDTGSREEAVAAWQALLELTFFRPDGPGHQFEDFWESEAPRIGEAGAAGWKQYVLDDAKGLAPDPLESVQAPPVEMPQSRDVYKAWSQREVALSEAARLPARTLDGGMEDDDNDMDEDEDTDRVVTFTNIESWIFMIPQSLIPGLTAPLIDAFLIFCGLPPASSSEWARTLYKDQFLAPVGGTIPSEHIVEGKPDIYEDESIVRRPPIFHRPHGSFALAPDLLFPGIEWFRYLEPQIQASLVDGEWLEATLSLLVCSAGIQPLSEYYLAVSFARDPRSIKKTAKRLLRQSPDNAVLFQAYALAQHARGDNEAAAKVLESTLSSSLPSGQLNRLRLHYSTAWVPFTRGDLKLSKKLLCAAGCDTNPGSQASDVSSTDVLKANSVFSGGISASLSVGDVKLAETAAECLVLFSYLTNREASEPMSRTQGNISAAMQSLDSACKDFAIRGHGKSPWHERLVQCGAHLLYLHATRGPHRRAYIREQITKHLHVFPSNTILLSILEWSDAGMRIVDETRQLLRDATLLPNADCVANRIFAIQHELGRGNVHAAKAAFEQAVRSDACKSSVALWVWYIRFAHAHKKQLRGNVAVNTFYRAVRHCPWAKAVFMEAFSTLHGEIGSDELMSAYRMMKNMGLRVHGELDRFLQSRGEVDMMERLDRISSNQEWRQLRQETFGLK